MLDYTHFTKVQESELRKFCSSFKIINQAEVFANQLKNTIGLKVILENDESRLDAISKLENTISETKVNFI